MFGRTALVDAAVVQRDVLLSLACVLTTLLLSAVLFMVQVHAKKHKVTRALSSNGSATSKPEPAKLTIATAAAAAAAAAGDDEEQTSSKHRSSRKHGEPPETAAAQTPLLKRAPLKKLPKNLEDIMKATVMSVFSEIQETKWVQVHADKIATVLSIQEPDLPDRYKAICQINASAELVFKSLYDLRERVKWDSSIDKTKNNRVVASFDSSYTLSYYATTPQFGTSGREFVNLRQLMQLENNSGFLIVGHAVDLPEHIPGDKSLVRAHNYGNGELIQRGEGNTCQLTYFVQVDLKLPGGWLAKTVMRNVMGGSLSKMFGELKAYCESHPNSSSFSLISSGLD